MALLQLQLTSAFAFSIFSIIQLGIQVGSILRSETTRNTTLLIRSQDSWNRSPYVLLFRRTIINVTEHAKTSGPPAPSITPTRSQVQTTLPAEGGLSAQSKRTATKPSQRLPNRLRRRPHYHQANSFCIAINDALDGEVQYLLRWPQFWLNPVEKKGWWTFHWDVASFLVLFSIWMQYLYQKLREYMRLRHDESRSGWTLMKEENLDNVLRCAEVCFHLRCFKGAHFV